MDHKDKILELAESAFEWNLIQLKDIPRIPLYMEQLTSFFDEALAGARRDEADKILTKTMINNYTKEGTLPRPNGKKYSREHMIRLMYIFLLKQVLSLQDIKRMFDLMESDNNIETIYGTYLEMVGDYREQHLENLKARMANVESKLVEKGIYTDENFEMMLMLLTITEATAGKMLVWRILDQLSEQLQLEKEAAKDREKETRK